MSLFEPKATIELIRSGEEVQPLLDEKGKRLLIDRYFEVSGRKVIWMRWISFKFVLYFSLNN